MTIPNIRSKTTTVEQLAKVVSAKEVIGDKTTMISGVETLSLAVQHQVSFYDNIKYFDDFKNTQASACFIKEKDIANAKNDLILIVVDEPYLANAFALNEFYKPIPKTPFISKLSYISDKAKIGKNVHISNFVNIGDDVVIEDDVSIDSNVNIEGNTYIEKGVDIRSSVSIKDAYIGENTIIHNGVRIGQDGFGFASSKEYGIYKIIHIGKVRIGKNVEIGANTCIDKAVTGETTIGDYTKIDNLVQIAHNVKIGKYCFIASQVGIAGSCIIEDAVQIGGQAGLAPHIKILKKTQIGAQSGIYKTNDTPGETLMGYPAMPIKTFWKIQAFTKKMLNKK